MPVTDIEIGVVIVREALRCYGEGNVVEMRRWERPYRLKSKLPCKDSSDHDSDAPTYFSIFDLCMDDICAWRGWAGYIDQVLERNEVLPYKSSLGPGLSTIIASFTYARACDW